MNAGIILRFRMELSERNASVFAQAIHAVNVTLLSVVSCLTCVCVLEGKCIWHDVIYN